ncbi:hypothetical protein MM188_003180 [Vibrio cholerae]|nr:hypothetical protein [Vibrio cholerae]
MKAMKNNGNFVDQMDQLKELRQQAAEAVIRFVSNEMRISREEAIKELAKAAGVTQGTVKLEWLRAGVPLRNTYCVVKFLNSIHSIKWGTYQVRPTLRELENKPLMTEREFKRVLKIAS